MGERRRSCDERERETERERERERDNPRCEEFLSLFLCVFVFLLLFFKFCFFSTFDFFLGFSFFSLLFFFYTCPFSRPLRRKRSHEIHFFSFHNEEQCLCFSFFCFVSVYLLFFSDTLVGSLVLSVFLFSFFFICFFVSNFFPVVCKS